MSSKRKNGTPSIAWENTFPSYETSERALVALLLDQGDLFSRVTTVIKSSDIQQESLRFIYRLLEQFHHNKTPWTWTTVADAIRTAEDRPADLDHPQHWIGELMREVADASELSFHIAQITQTRVRRELLENLPQLERDIKNPSANPTQLLLALKTMEQRLYDTNQAMLLRVVDQSNLTEEFRKDVNSIKTAPYCGTGFRSLDKHLVWGLGIGQVSVLCGRPSSGKSAFRSNIQVNLAKMGIPTMVISREQSFFAECCRFLAVADGTSLKKIITVRDWGNDPGFEHYVNGRMMDIENDWPITVVEPIGPYVLQDIRNEVMSAQSTGKKPRVVFIDLFAQLDDVNVSDKQATVIQQKVMEAANLAKELGIHICLLVQIRRLGNMTEKQRQEFDYREALKGSGGYEERADLVLMVERPAYWDKNQDDILMNVAVLKQKDGPTPTVQLSFDKECIRVRDDMENHDFTNGDINTTLDYLNDEQGEQDEDQG